MSVTWAPLHTTRDPDSLDHLRDARALIEQALGAIDLAVAQEPDDDVSGIRTDVASALARLVERIEATEGTGGECRGGGEGPSDLWRPLDPPHSHTFARTNTYAVETKNHASHRHKWLHI